MTLRKRRATIRNEVPPKTQCEPCSTHYYYGHMPAGGPFHGARARASPGRRQHLRPSAALGERGDAALHHGGIHGGAAAARHSGRTLAWRDRANTDQRMAKIL
jgi:hypothetical protein